MSERGRAFENGETTIERAWRRLREDGVGQLARNGWYSGIETIVERWGRATGAWEDGDPVFDREWDVLVVVDACRYDLMAEVVDEDDEREHPRWPWLTQPSQIRSLGSSSEEWMQRNFTGEFSEQMSETAHVTANVFSNWMLDGDDWLVLDEVWRDQWDDDIGTTPARPVIDRSIATWRDRAPEQMIVHLMQPHYPFIGGGGGLGEGRAKPLDKAVKEWGAFTPKKTIWNQLRDDEVEYEDVWEAYKRNLEYVLDELQTLVTSIDAQVVLTADHGNGLGEFGVYGHPTGLATRELRAVPMVEVTATDTGGYEPEADRSTADVNKDTVNERLRALGYR